MTKIVRDLAVDVRFGALVCPLTLRVLESAQDVFSPSDTTLNESSSQRCKKHYTGAEVIFVLLKCIPVHTCSLRQGSQPADPSSQSTTTTRQFKKLPGHCQHNEPKWSLCSQLQCSQRRGSSQRATRVRLRRPSISTHTMLR